MEPRPTLIPLDAALVALGYVCGLFPTGVLLTRRRGIDVRRAGSGNVGATNVLRTAGPALGLLTLVGDAAKGALPVALARLAAVEPWVPAAVAVAAVAGHVFPATSGFRGGKGVATAFGTLLCLAPIATGVAAAVFGLAVATTRRVSVGSLAAAAVVPAVLALVGDPPSVVGAGAAVALIVWIRHAENLGRLVAGTEPRVDLHTRRAPPSK